MKKTFIYLFVAAIAALAPANISAQFKLGRAIQGAAKAAQAFTLTDQQMAAYVKESVDWMDKNNPVAADDDPYAIRLKKLTEGITDADGIPLNFKVYKVIDVNAFACPDGSVRVFSSLMDIMNDDELLGIIGHEIGHVVKRHSKTASSSSSSPAHSKMPWLQAAVWQRSSPTRSSAPLGEGLIGAKYSQKQEKEADDCGYDFLVANGKNPWGMVMSFEKFLNMEAQSGVKAGMVDRMFSSHPDTQARINAMTARCRKDGYERPAATEGAAE